MKAIIQEGYGDPDILRIEKINKPTPQKNEVLIRVKASSVNFGNMAFMKGDPFISRFWSGIKKPKQNIPGWDLSGIIESVGSEVKGFKSGDEVFTELSLEGKGTYCEYVTVKTTNLARKPANVSFLEAGTIATAAGTALQSIMHKFEIQPGHNVLINGASGGVGMFAVQIAKALGANVTAVCSTRHVDSVKRIGADIVIDYTKDELPNCETYDYILGANGYNPLLKYKKMLKPNGAYVCSGGSGLQIFQSIIFGPLISILSNKSFSNVGVAKIDKKIIEILRDLLEQKKIKPYIDKVYSLEELPDALRHYEKGHVTGKIAIQI